MTDTRVAIGDRVHVKVSEFDTPGTVLRVDRKRGRVEVHLDVLPHGWAQDLWFVPGEYTTEGVES